MSTNISIDYITHTFKGQLQPTLENIELSIRPGEKVALVGPTGAGKSSIIRLLARLYDVSHGQILIDGVDIRDLTLASLAIALIPQPSHRKGEQWQRSLLALHFVKHFVEKHNCFSTACSATIAACSTCYELILAFLTSD